MWYLFIVAVIVVASRAEPVDYSNHDTRNEILIPSESLRDLKDLSGLKELSPRLREIEFEDTNDFPVLRKFRGKYEPEIPGGEQLLPDTDSNAFEPSDDMLEEFEEVEMNRLSSFLSSLLRQQTWKRPLVLIEEPNVSDDFPDDENSEIDLENRQMWKRSRYHRRYPWKRQNSRSRNFYDNEPTHLCTPSREDVFQLLVALHNVRQGNKSRTVNFCNRRRPVGTVFTNIRFLGRRK